MGDNGSIIIAVLIDIVLLYFLTKAAKKYGIYLSMPIKVMFFTYIHRAIYTFMVFYKAE